MSNEYYNEPSEAQIATRNDVIDLGSGLRFYLKYWWLFLLSLIFCAGAAAFYIYKKNPVYKSMGMLMLNQQEDGGMGQTGGLSSMLATFGLGNNSGVNPENEQMKIFSHTSLVSVIKELDLNISYWQDNGFFKRKKNYFHNSPIKVSLPEAVQDTIMANAKIHLEGDTKGPWSLSVKINKKTVLDTEITKLPYNAKTPWGTYTISATDHFPSTGKLNVCAQVLSLDEECAQLEEQAHVIYVSNKADALQIDMEDAVPARGREVVNAMMALYNKKRNEDRTEFNEHLLSFIDNRLISLYQELEASETKIEKYKQKNQLVNPDAEAQYMFARKGVIDENSVELQARIKVFEMIQQSLKGGPGNYTMIPFAGSSVGLGEGYNSLIDNYNKLIMERMDLAVSAKEGSAALNKLDQQIDAVRTNILSSVNKELQSARISYDAVQREEQKGDNRMTQIPTMEHQLIALYRDREVQNQIYAFLLQKREETQIALSQVQPYGKVIDDAYTLVKPISPKPMLCYAVGIFLGIAFPIVILRFRRRR